jgi:hypothetical protein
LETIVIAPSRKIDQWALPFIEGVFYCSPDQILKVAAAVIDGIRKIRVKFAGRDYAEAAIELSADMRSLGLSEERITHTILSTPLKD